MKRTIVFLSMLITFVGIVSGAGQVVFAQESFGRRTLDTTAVGSGVRRVGAFIDHRFSFRRRSLATHMRRLQEVAQPRKDAPPRYVDTAQDELPDICARLEGIEGARCRFEERIRQRLLLKWSRHGHEEEREELFDGVERKFGSGTTLEKVFQTRWENRLDMLNNE